MTRSHQLIVAAAVALGLLVAPAVFVMGTLLAATATLLVPLVLALVLLALRDRPAGRRTRMP